MTQPHSRRAFLSRAALTGGVLAALPCPALTAAQPSVVPRCQVVPLAEHQTALRLQDREKARWHFGTQSPRPFFFPFNGPSGVSLTRMGHPGAPNHDHHRSVWFAHNKVNGLDFWGDTSTARIRQKQWLCYEDGDDQCVMAVRLGWFDGDPGRELMEQTLIAVARPLEGGEHTLELQSLFRAVDQPVELGRTNFGFLAVRVARSISGFFGGGTLTDSEGRRGEPAVFGKRARWMDYSGAVTDGVVEGITYFDHPENPGAPTHWHVREDGWMGASFSMKEARTLEPDQPLRLRYLLHAHAGPVDPDRAGKVLDTFATAPFYAVMPSKAPHRQFELRPAAK